jgi:transcriptional regulator with XRE-family HTH domain
VDAQRLGRVVRAARHRLGWPQWELARRAGVSQPSISVLERGFADRVPLYRLRPVLKCLDIELTGYELRSRVGIVDRLLDEGHATLAGRVADLLGRSGWEVRPEVSYSRYGERGSFDLVAWHARTLSLLVVEVKTDLVSVEATLRKLDEKVRLGRSVAREAFGWAAGTVSSILVLPRSSRSHRQVARHSAVIDLALPGRSVRAKIWLRKPSGRFAGVLFVSEIGATTLRRTKSTRIRIRRPRDDSSRVA